MEVELSSKIFKEIQQKLEENASEQVTEFRVNRYVHTGLIFFHLKMYLLHLLGSTLFFGIVSLDLKRDVNIVTPVINGMD